MGTRDPLGRLLRQADAVAERATDLVARSVREIRGELSLMVGELHCATSAADRTKAEEMILAKASALSKRLNRLMEAQNELAVRQAAKKAEQVTGLTVAYSPHRAEMICELATAGQGENLAAVFTDKMAQNAITALRHATVKVLRQNAVEGGTLKSMTKALNAEWQKAARGAQNFRFKDAGGHVWDTKDYMHMNVRTNAMRIYNDCLVDDIARATGGDLVRVSRGGDPCCRLCSPWEGVILSVSGKTKGLPTYEQARQAGCFHPNCVHTLEYVDEAADKDEIARQMKHPVTAKDATDPDAADERRYAIDQERYRAKGLTADEARVEVDRDNLADNIRHGLLRSDAADVVSRMTDAQVTAICKNGNPPRFEVTKKGESESYRSGSRGGVVHVAKDADTAKILSLTGADAANGTGGKTTVKEEEEKALKAKVERQYKEDVEALLKVTDAALPSDIVKAAFTDIDPQMLHTFAGKVTGIFQTKGGSYCQGAGTQIFIGKNAWSSHKQTVLHESGHAVLHALVNECAKNNDQTGTLYTRRLPDSSKGEKGKRYRSFLTDYGQRIFDTLKSDAEAFFDSVSGKKIKTQKRVKTGEGEDPITGRHVTRYKTVEVETSKRDWASLTDVMITKRLFGEEKSFSELTLDERRVYGVVSDTLQAVTGNAYHGQVGHNDSYYSDKTAGMEMRFHEAFANISAALALRNDTANANAIGIFKSYARIIAHDFYGVDIQ